MATRCEKKNLQSFLTQNCEPQKGIYRYLQNENTVEMQDHKPDLYLHLPHPLPFF